MLVLQEAEVKMKAVIEHLQKELKSLRSNRVSVGVLDCVMVSLNGADMPLKSVAMASSPEPRQLLITPFDKQFSKAIEKGLEKSGIDTRVSVEAGGVLRLFFAPMDEEKRLEMVKIAKEKGEEAKIAIRDVRRKGNDQLKKMQKEGIITADMRSSSEQKLQDLTNGCCEKSDKAVKERSQELLTV